MATNFKNIRAAIKAKIDTLENVGVTYNYERSTFAKFPAVIIAASENESDYGSTQNDRLVFVFKLRAYYPIKQESDHQAAEGFLEGVVDEILTSFKERNALGTACDWLEPAPSAWYYEERSEGVYRVAEIRLRCVKYVG